MNNKELQKENEELTKDMELLWQQYVEVVEENKEFDVLEAEFDALAEENYLLKETLGTIFDCDPEWLTITFTKLKERWEDE